MQCSMPFQGSTKWIKHNNDSELVKTWSVYAMTQKHSKFV